MGIYGKRHSKKRKIFCLSVRKRTGFYLLLLFSLALTGCSSVENAILYGSGIMGEDYEEYIMLKENGQLDQNGYYETRGNEEEDFKPPTDSVHVTFGNNAYLNVKYYADAELTEQIDTEQCYLKKNDCIYAEEPVCEHPYNKWYRFDRFCVCAYDKDGNRGEELNWQNDEKNEGLVLRVPADYEGREISVEPLGRYEEQTFSLDDYYVDSAGQPQQLNGVWSVNEQEITDKEVRVNPAEPLTIDYHYDPDEYCFVSSEPYSFYHDKGIVRFETAYADSENTTYSVQLRPVEGIFLFDPRQYVIEHGTVEFLCNGRPITEKCDVADGDVIYYEAKPEFGYRISEEKGSITVNANNPELTNENIQSAVKFYPNEEVEVKLPQPEMGGRIEYMADGKKLTDVSCKLLCGAVIRMNYINWNGWQINPMLYDGMTYKVSEQQIGQCVTLKGVDIYKDVFVEASEHKPNLHIVVSDDFKDATIQLLAAGIDGKDISYAIAEKKRTFPWSSKDRTVCNEIIGTDRDISIKVTNDTIFQGKAMKLDIVKKDNEGRKYHTIKYVTKLTGNPELISIYDLNEAETSSIVYTDIEITINKVEVVEYKPLTAGHATVTVTLDDVTEPDVLKAGDILEQSREVRIMVTPAADYYMTGSDIKNNSYTDTVEYSEWDKEGEKILQKHPVKKLIRVNLDQTDSYGRCVYELDGRSVSGTIKVKEEQKLVLKYTLTNSDYKIVRSGGVNGFLGGMMHRNTESRTIPLSEKLDGKTIRRADYITVERK